MGSDSSLRPAGAPQPPDSWDAADAPLEVLLDLDAGGQFKQSRVRLTPTTFEFPDPNSGHPRTLARAEVTSAAVTPAGKVLCLTVTTTAETLAFWLTPRRRLAAEALTTRLALKTEGRTAQPNTTTGDDPRGSKAQNRSYPLLRLFVFAGPYRGLLALGLLLTLLATLASLVPPYLTMPIMDEVLIPFERGEPRTLGHATPYLLALLGAALVAWVLSWLRTYVLALVSERIGMGLRMAAFDRLLHLSLDFYGEKRTGDLMSRVGSETDRICTFLSLHALDFVTDALVICATTAILVSIDPWLTLVTLIPLPFIGWLIYLVRERLRLGFQRMGRVWSEVTNVISDVIPGIRVVKAFGQEQRELARFRAANLYNLEQNDRLNRVWSLFSPTVALLTEAGLLVVWSYGIHQVLHHRISLGVLTAFLAYIGRFYTRLDSMSRIVSVTQRASASAARLFDILDRHSEVQEGVRPVELKEVRGGISLTNVGFGYGARDVLQGVTLEIRPGEMIGLVGASGAGKTTLINLLCRFYDVHTGSIQIDGVDLRDLSLHSYRRHLGMVLQEPVLFYGTIAENIAYARPEASHEAIIAAAGAAHAHEFILKLPHGYDSIVGERGQRLSGGERQRISIARALLIDPKILILDEATSSVDNETERLIQSALDRLVSGRTTIAIAHRLSTLRKADRLVVLERGVVAEIGNHEELLARRGAYFRLVEAQRRATQQTDQIL